jgi:chromosome segregation ATPase
MDDLRRRLAEYEVLLAEADSGGEQVNAELQQLREQVQTLTRERDEHARKLGFARECAEMSLQQVQDEAGKVERLKEQVQALTLERDRYRNQLAGAIEHSSAAAGRQQVLEALQAWLRPVLELVAEHPEDCGPLAVSVLGYLPGIASRLIEE